jgi:hypothetical protein
MDAEMEEAEMEEECSGQDSDEEARDYYMNASFKEDGEDDHVPVEARLTYKCFPPFVKTCHDFVQIYLMTGDQVRHLMRQE